MRLTPIEAKIIKEILEADAPELLHLVDDLMVYSREDTAVGRFVQLSYENYGGRHSKNLGSNLVEEIDGFDDLIRFSLSVHDCNIEMLEMFTNGEKNFPEDLSGIRITPLDLDEA